MEYSAQISEINKGFISQDMEKIVVLKGRSETVGIGDKAEGEKCEDRDEAGIDTLADFLHSTVPNDQAHAFSLWDGKLQNP